ncbi:hypothetical protein [Microtetraspora malaysiensis]|uniref:Uncharacterized protein n=1 Tax=Microtetraspora malaysiensis TaxID=161358 RepID=A0ABW6SPR5_9ACTN
MPFDDVRPGLSSAVLPGLVCPGSPVQKFLFAHTPSVVVYDCR